MRVVLTQTGRGQFEAENERGARLRLEASADLGGTDAALRPMEGVLASLAGCSAIDVQMILEQQREPMTGLRVEVEGTRAEGTPRVFTAIALRFVIRGQVAENKARRAVALSMEKYCSVARMLAPSVSITHDVALEP